MSINNIAALLERFKKLKPSDTYVKESFISTIKEVVNIEIYKEEIKVQNSNIFLQAHPTLKTEIFLNKNEILTLMEEKMGKKVIKNII